MAPRLARMVRPPREQQRRRALASAWAASALLAACVARAPSRGSAAAEAALDSRAASGPVLNSPASDTARPGTPPKYPSTTLPLSRESAYLRRAASPDFWSLSPYYVGQEDDVSCSLASLTMLVNAARRHAPLDSESPLTTQALLRRRVNSPVWERGLAPGGEGVTLDELARLATQSLQAFGLEARVTVTHVPEASAQALAQLQQALRANEATADDWLLVNFLAAAYVGVGDYGHIAPVGAYDADTRRVLILDPDRAWYEPYWIPDEVALTGMATPDSVTGEPRGYLQVSLCPASGCR
jgi:hypothetical protein